MRAIIFLLSVLLAFPALAWEASSLADVRFSPDGRYFSFVEYGESDADEASYASMYVIDIAGDAWVSGTPVRVALDGAGATARKALDAVRRKGRPLIGRFNLRDAGRAAVRFADVSREFANKRRQAVAVPALGPVRLRLLERPAASAHFCSEDHPVGIDFRLELTGPRQSVVLADYLGRLPRSRGCADGYDIAAVYLHRVGERTVVAALVGVYTPGWEGSDRRLIAVTKQLP